MKPDDVSFIDVLPSNDRGEDTNYLETAEAFARASVATGFDYTLVTVGSKRFDPWVLAQHLMTKVPGFKPLIAINPAFQHPVTLAQKTAALARLFPNRFAVNVVSGSFLGDLKAIGDETKFEERNERLRDFHRIFAQLVAPSGRADHRGRYFRAINAEIRPTVPADVRIPRVLSGTITESLQTDELDFSLKNLRPSGELPDATGPRAGLGFGLFARATTEEASARFDETFKEDRKGEWLFAMASANAETPWSEWLKENAERKDTLDFHLGPLKSYRSFAPYIVGSYDDLAARIGDYRARGYDFFLVDYPPGDHLHVGEVLRRLRTSPSPL